MFTKYSTFPALPQILILDQHHLLLATFQTPIFAP